MSTKPTPEAVRVKAVEIAHTMADRLRRAYIASVKGHVEHYSELPDEGDFLAWVEGYDWSDSDV